jgi:hypothetical protein
MSINVEFLAQQRAYMSSVPLPNYRVTSLLGLKTSDLVNVPKKNAPHTYLPGRGSQFFSMK